MYNSASLTSLCIIFFTKVDHSKEKLTIHSSLTTVSVNRENKKVGWGLVNAGEWNNLKPEIPLIGLVMPEKRWERGGKRQGEGKGREVQKQAENA